MKPCGATYEVIKGNKIVMDNCSTCGNAVEEEHEALICDLCSRWEQVRCRERPSEALYQALVNCNIQCIMYICSCY